LIHEPQAQPMNDRFDFSRRCDRDVQLSVDGQHKRNEEKHSRPSTEFAAFSNSGSAGIDRGENSGVAYSTQGRHEYEFRQRVVHLPTNKLQEGRLPNVRAGEPILTMR
jgi:hypothetical protein